MTAPLSLSLGLVGGCIYASVKQLTSKGIDQFTGETYYSIYPNTYTRSTSPHPLLFKVCKIAFAALGTLSLFFVILNKMAPALSKGFVFWGCFTAGITLHEALLAPVIKVALEALFQSS